MKQEKFYAIDLFCGAGGLSFGLEQSGFDIKLSNEIEPDFCETYRLNHRNTKVIQEDIKNVDFNSELQKINFKEKIHLVSGGPPCQGFSTLGKKNKFDLRNSLFYQFIRVVKDANPDFVFFENVSGFKNMYNGEMFHILLEELDALKYSVQHSIINAVSFGLPQHRERTIVIGYKKDFDFKFPTGEFTSSQLFSKKPYRTLRDAISDLPGIESNQTSTKYAAPPQNDYQKSLRGNLSTLSEHNSPNHGEKLLKMISYVPYGGTVENIPVELRPKSYFANTYSRLEWDKPTPTITRNFGTPSSSRCIHPELDRGLTTREGARLQGFPDDYFFAGGKGSKNLQIGNAVPPIFGYSIGKEIHLSLQKYYSVKSRKTKRENEIALKPVL